MINAKDVRTSLARKLSSAIAEAMLTRPFAYSTIKIIRKGAASDLRRFIDILRARVGLFDSAGFIQTQTSPLCLPITLALAESRIVGMTTTEGIPMKLIAAGTLALALTANFAQPRQALAWGDEGHQVVALIAQSFLDADVRRRINALLAADTDDLTAHDIASAATWADKYRDANFEDSRAKTRQWHFTDIEITARTFTRPASITLHCHQALLPRTAQLPTAWWTSSSSSPLNWQTRRPTPRSRLLPSNSSCTS
jgi:hypothetical protein